jgi:hypothetical protein
LLNGADRIKRQKELPALMAILPFKTWSKKHESPS